MAYGSVGSSSSKSPIAVLPAETTTNNRSSSARVEARTLLNSAKELISLPTNEVTRSNATSGSMLFLDGDHFLYLGGCYLGLHACRFWMTWQ